MTARKRRHAKIFTCRHHDTLVSRQPDAQSGVMRRGCDTDGGSCSANIETENQINAGFWWRIYQGKFGSFRFGMQYSYTTSDVLRRRGRHQAATTDDSMVFTTIRYYPF